MTRMTSKNGKSNDYGNGYSNDYDAEFEGVEEFGAESVDPGEERQLEIEFKDASADLEGECVSNNIPEGAESADGRKMVRIPVLKTIPKILFDNYRYDMYKFVTGLAKSGRLSDITGIKAKNRYFNSETLTFPAYSFWRIDREDFYADVQVKMKLETSYGIQEWNGVLVVWCTFEEDENGNGHKLVCTFEELRDRIDRSGDGFDMLDSYLIPYYTNQRIDEISERMWKESKMAGALTDPSLRKAEEYAKSRGLNIVYHPVYEHGGVDSILFFREDDLVIGEDRLKKEKSGKKKRVKADKGKNIRIPANTIVINTNKIKKEYSGFKVFHEIMHDEHHYLFFCLQDIGCSDPRKFETIEITEEEYKKYKDPVFFMENQADRGAFGMMMPAADTRKRIREALASVSWYKNAGDRFQQAGIKIAREIAVPHFRLRARMVQLGYIEAKGAMNYVEREMIDPFAFGRDAWRNPEHTFIIKPGELNRLMKDSDELREMIESGEYAYADGHVVKADERFLTRKEGRLFLTDRALGRIDVCSLRFIKVPVQQNVGSYVHGRMYLDPHRMERIEFFLQDTMVRENIDELDAMPRYEAEFPDSFAEALPELMHKCGETQETMAEKFNISIRTWRYWMEKPDEKFTTDRLIAVSLMLELPDYISALLFKTLDRTLGDRRRSRALEYIRSSLWDQGIDRANEYLESHGLDKLQL